VVAAALLFRILVDGIVPGDEPALRIVRPDGKVVAGARAKDVDQAKALAWSNVGMRRRGANWPAGVYRGEYRLARCVRLLLHNFVEVRVE